MVMLVLGELVDLQAVVLLHDLLLEEIFHRIRPANCCRGKVVQHTLQCNG